MLIIVVYLAFFSFPESSAKCDLHPHEEAESPMIAGEPLAASIVFAALHDCVLEPYNGCSSSRFVLKENWLWKKHFSFAPNFANS